MINNIPFSSYSPKIDLKAVPFDYGKVVVIDLDLTET